MRYMDEDLLKEIAESLRKTMSFHKKCGCEWKKVDDYPGAMTHVCGTPFLMKVDNAVDDFRNGRPVEEGISIDEVVMTVFNDWAFVGEMSSDDGDVKLYAPLISVEGENTTERLMMETDIEGFTPIRGHEYRLKVRRIYLTRNPFYHHYELIELISDNVV